jgi:hypothetical protein
MKEGNFEKKSAAYKLQISSFPQKELLGLEQVKFQNLISQHSGN